MKHIYFCLDSASEHILSEKEISASSSGYYYIVDILGRIYRLPIASTFIYEEEWDGDIGRIDNRFRNAVAEITGNTTGILKINKDDKNNIRS